VPRPYNSQRRQEQAAATRRSILAAAQRLFVEHGYVPTTMEDIAVEAGVSLKTVYLAFSTKSGVLRAVWDLLLKGDTDDAPVAQRSAYLEVLAEPDPRRQLVLNARNARAAKVRIGPMFAVIRSAAAVDADGAALWELIQTDFHANQRVIVESVAAKGALRPGLDVEHATDILWTLNHPDVWLLLSARRGWSADEFEQWFAAACCRELLGDEPAEPLAEPAAPPRRPARKVDGRRSRDR
jgi:AcrR family transcriptional regulator